MANISTWTTSATGNNSVSPDGFPEGMNPSGVNDSAREVMGAVRRWYVDAEWINWGDTLVRQTNNSFLVSRTATQVYTAGRRLKLYDSTTILGEILASSASGANTLVTVSSSALTSSLSSGAVGILNPQYDSTPVSSTQTLTNKTIDVASNTINFHQITSALGSDVALNNAGAFFDGPSIAQGTSGTWFVSGTVVCRDTTTANAAYSFKLWDGTTVIASATVIGGIANSSVCVALSGYITTPAGNLRISCKDGSSTNGAILFNNSGFSKDSNITAIRLA